MLLSARLPLCRLAAALGLALFCCPAAPGQVRKSPPLRLGGALPSRVRASATESWGTFDFDLTNLTGEDQQARVLVFYEDRPDLQYGRDVWVPAHSSLSSWMLVGPAPVRASATAVEMQVLLYDRSRGKERLILPPGAERVRGRRVLYRQREPSTAVLFDEDPPSTAEFGRLPGPETRDDEALWLARTFRHAVRLSGHVHALTPASLPSTPEGLDGIDHVVVASGEAAYDPAGVQALRHWLQQGGRVWVMLDMVDPEVLAPLLGDALDFQIVGRVALTDFTLAAQPAELGGAQPQQHERPVDLVRVVLPPQEPVRHTVAGWPAWFTRQVGRGKVVFTTLGPRGWYRPRGRTGPRSPYPNFPELPVARHALDEVAGALHAGQENRARIEAFRPLLAEQIGYSVLKRGRAVLIFGAFLLAAVAAGVVLRRLGRPELLGWLGPAAALGAAGAFLAFGEASRTAPPTVAVAQVVTAVPGSGEAAIRGLLAVYRPGSGPAVAGTTQGGFFDLDMSGTEGKTRRLVLTDLGSWHWENLELTGGVRLAPFRYTAATGAPIAAVARFGPEGIEGKLTAGPFQNPADLLLSTPGGRNLAVRLGPGGTFRSGGDDALPAGQFLVGAVLSDRQQRRQELYRDFLKRTPAERFKGEAALLAWADPIDTGFRLAPPGARTVGSALLVVPLRLERPAPGARVTVPGPLVPYRRVVSDFTPQPPVLESRRGIDQHLRFQLPAVVLPLQVERARLVAKISAPTRRATLAVRSDGRFIEVRRVESPLDPIRIDLTEARHLQLDDEGGLHVNLSVSDPLKGDGPLQPGEKWEIEYIELEVSGKTAER